MKNNFGISFFICLTISIGVIFTHAQTSAPVVIESNESQRCEWVSAMFASFTQENNKKNRIIIISYLGKNELKSEIAKKRIDVARKHLVTEQSGTNFFGKPQNIISAIAPERTKEGKLEFYIEGEVQFTISFVKNRNFCLSPEYP